MWIYEPARSVLLDEKIMIYHNHFEGCVFEALAVRPYRGNLYCISRITSNRSIFFDINQLKFLLIY